MQPWGVRQKGFFNPDTNHFGQSDGVLLFRLSPKRAVFASMAAAWSQLVQRG